MNKVKVRIVSITDVKNFCSAALNSTGKVDVVSGTYKVDGASLMGVLSLDLSNPVEVVYTDEDFKDAIASFIIEE